MKNNGGISISKYVPADPAYSAVATFYQELGEGLMEYFGRRKRVRDPWSDPDCMRTDGSFNIKTHPTQEIVARVNAFEKTVTVTKEYEPLFPAFTVKRIARKAAAEVPKILAQREKAYRIYMEQSFGFVPSPTLADC